VVKTHVLKKDDIGSVVCSAPARLAHGEGNGSREHDAGHNQKDDIEWVHPPGEGLRVRILGFWGW
jgi:hypothetical protein